MLMICFCALFKNKIVILYDILVANISFKLERFALHTHIWINLVLIVLLIKYWNFFESHHVWRKEFRNKLFNPVYDWLSKAHTENLYTFN